MRPSDLLAVENSWDAFCLDRAVYLYGSTLKAELDGVEGKKKAEIERKREKILDRWFPEARSKSKKKFADPGRQI